MDLSSAIYRPQAPMHLSEPEWIYFHVLHHTRMKVLRSRQTPSISVLVPQNTTTRMHLWGTHSMVANLPDLRKVSARTQTFGRAANKCYLHIRRRCLLPYRSILPHTRPSMDMPDQPAYKVSLRCWHHLVERKPRQLLVINFLMC